MGGVSTARFGDFEVEEEKGEVRSRLQCREARKRGTREEGELSVDHEGSVAAGPSLAQPGQLHRQSGQPTHPLL